MGRTNIAQEFGSQYLQGLNPIGWVSNASGFVKALIDPPSDNAAKSGTDNLMPSVGAYRMVNRAKSQAYAQDKKYNGKAKKNYLSELLGTFTSGTVPTIAGAAIGAYLSRDQLLNSSLSTKDRLMGVMKGTGIGIGLATAGNLLGLLGSTITKRRTEKEQVEHDKRVHLEDWVIPGFGMYNKGKRLGRSEGDYEEHPERHEKIKKELDSKKDDSTSAKALKALALIAGAGLTGYGLYKLPSVFSGQANKIKELTA